MALTAEQKKPLVEKYGRKEGDTGSPEVQIALLTEEINNLTRHFKQYLHDNNSKRGLLRRIGRRKRLLKYLYSTDYAKYEKLIGDLGIRGNF